MPNRGNNFVGAALREAPEPLCLVSAPDDERAESPFDRGDGPLAILRRKISSRLARHVALGRRRLVNVAPMVSFTFDDAAASAGAAGAERLERMGGRGTYYVASGLIGCREAGYAVIDRDGLRDLHRKGHEIGLHGHVHRAVGDFSAQGFRDDLQRNREYLQAIDDGFRPANFAYPHGLAAFARKRQLYELVTSSRGIVPGIVAGSFDPQFLRCVELADERLTPDGLVGYLDAVVRSTGWLIFCSHDIAAAPSRYGCTLDLFQRALDGAAARGIELVTIAGGLARSRAFGGRALSVSEATESKLS
jgi:peptidoglycan/xylan/chitin deacetylase (PgdA/CDA1 family)